MQAISNNETERLWSTNEKLAERDFEIERLKDIFRDLLKYYVSNDAKEVIDVIKQAIGENGGE